MDTAQQRNAARIEHLKRKLKARTGPDGKPHSGYKENVAAIQAEIDRLQAHADRPQPE